MWAPHYLKKLKNVTGILQEVISFRAVELEDIEVAVVHLDLQVWGRDGIPQSMIARW